MFLAFALKPSFLFTDSRPLTGIDPYVTFRQAPIDFDTLRAGDLIVRMGRSFFSDRLRKYSKRDKRYSHCSLVTKGRDGKSYVFHSIGGSDNPDQVVRCDSVFTFLNPEDVSGFAVYRYQLPSRQIHSMDSIARQYYREKRMFDMKFDLDDDERLYCAEFVYKVLLYATGNLEIVNLSRQGEKLYVGVDDLYLNNLTQKLFEHEYH